MTNPGAQAIMIIGRQHGDSRSDLIDPSSKLGEEPMVDVLIGQRSQKPRRVLEQIGVGIVDAAELLSRHRMSAQKSLARVFPENFYRLLYRRNLGAADIGQQRSRRQTRAEPPDQINNR